MGQVTVRFEDETDEAVMLRDVNDLFKKKNTFVNKNTIIFQISRSYHGLTMFLLLCSALKMFSYLIHLTR